MTVKTLDVSRYTYLCLFNSGSWISWSIRILFAPNTVLTKRATLDSALDRYEAVCDRAELIRLAQLKNVGSLRVSDVRPSDPQMTRILLFQSTSWNVAIRLHITVFLSFFVNQCSRSHRWPHTRCYSTSVHWSACVTELCRHPQVPSWLHSEVKWKQIFYLIDLIKNILLI